MNAKTLAITLIGAAFAASAYAQDVRLYRSAEAVDPLEVARILGNEPEAAPTIKFRSIRLLEPARPAPATPRPAALALPVQFSFDSAMIMPQARPQLDQLAEGIKLLPPGKSIVIEGHTDGTGSDAYNLQLSHRRAIAVKAYLVQVHGIESSRLQTEGYGEYRLLQGTLPTAPENRRVQFRGG